MSLELGNNGMPRLLVSEFILLSPLVLVILLSDLYYSGIGRAFDYVALNLILLIAILYKFRLSYDSYQKFASVLDIVFISRYPWTI